MKQKKIDDPNGTKNEKKMTTRTRLELATSGSEVQRASIAPSGPYRLERSRRVLFDQRILKSEKPTNTIENW